jgi:uncharacterized protein (TIGR03086 family)
MTDLTLPRWHVLDESFSALRATVAAVPETAWDLPTPCSQWSVRQVLEHAAGDQLAWASAVAGGPGPDYNPFDPSGHQAGTAEDLLEAALTRSASAWATISPDDASASTPLPQGVLAPQLAVAACALDAAVHAWDLAMSTGQESPLTDDLASALLPAATAIAEPLRAYGVFAAAIDHEPGQSPSAALLRYLGRNPGWTPTSPAA